MLQEIAANNQERNTLGHLFALCDPAQAGDGDQHLGGRDIRLAQPQLPNLDGQTFHAHPPCPGNLYSVGMSPQRELSQALRAVRRKSRKSS